MFVGGSVAFILDNTIPGKAFVSLCCRFCYESTVSRRHVNVELRCLFNLICVTIRMILWRYVPRHSWGKRNQEAKPWLRCKCSGAGGNAILWPAVWNGLHSQTCSLQIHTNQSHIYGLSMWQEQTGTWRYSKRRRRRRSSTRGESGIAGTLHLGTRDGTLKQKDRRAEQWKVSKFWEGWCTKLLYFLSLVNLSPLPSCFLSMLQQVTACCKDVTIGNLVSGYLCVH